MSATLLQLTQIAKGPVHDGNLVAAPECEHLIEAGYVECIQGWNFLTALGMAVCIALKILQS